MSHKYLTPARQKFETSGSLFFAGFGLWIWLLTAAVPDNSPLSWLEISTADQLIIGQWFSVCAFIHGLGVAINGRWVGSPFLRFIGMFGHSTGLTFMVLISPNPFSTDVYVYAIASVVMILGTFNALENCATTYKKATE
jgi:hypothetical protein